MNPRRLAAILIVEDDKNDLWPLERPRFPFCCLPFFGGMTLLESAWQRLRLVAENENIWLLCPPPACDLAADLLPALNRENIIPSELGTLAAVHTLSQMFRDRGAAEITIVSRAAMVAGDEERFAEAMRDALRLAHGSDCLVACGVPAGEARSGYDYLIAGEACVRVSRVQGRDISAFILDAGEREAERALQTGNAWWNTGVYVWPNAAFLSEYAAISHEFAADPEHRETCSLEEALLSRTKNILLFGASFVFSPLRNYEDLGRYIRSDAAGNIQVGNVALYNTESCLAYNASPERLLAAAGLKDMLLVQTDDTVFVCPRGDEGQIRLLVEKLAKSDPRILRHIG